MALTWLQTSTLLVQVDPIMRQLLGSTIPYPAQIIMTTETMATPEASGSRPQTQAERAEVFKRLHPDEYLERFLAQGYRPDGRRVDGWRDVSINIGESSLPGTCIYASVDG